MIVEYPLYVLNPPPEEIRLVSPVSLDLETSGLSPWGGRDRIRLVAIKSGDKTYLLQPEYYSDLGAIFEKISKHLVIAHNAKFDLNFIYYSYGVLIQNIFCTMITSQVAQGGSRLFKNTLDHCLEYYLSIKLEADKKRLQKSFTYDSELTVEQLQYAAEDVQYLDKLKDKLVQIIGDQDLSKVLALELKLLPVLVKVECKGCLIDVDSWKNTLVGWETKRRECIKQLDEEYLRLYPYALFGNPNYASPKQVIGFFKQLGLKAPIKEERDTKRESADESTLDNYMNEYPDSPVGNFIELLKNYREYQKLLTTYGESFLDHVDKNNRLHTSYGQCSTATGRLSSKSPNLQNIPSDKSGEGGVVRDYFIAPVGYKIVTSDMTKAEVVIAADLSKDPLLLKGVSGGVDMHSELASISASIIYGQPVVISDSKNPITIGKHQIVPKEFRDIHKSVTFAKFYKGGPKRVYEVLSRYINPAVPARRRMRVAKNISEALDRAMPRLSQYLTYMIDKANTQGFLITTKLGRRRKFDSKVYGEAANAPIQGANADAMKIALVNIDKKLGNMGQIILTVHDEVVVEVADKHADAVAQMVREEVANALTWQLSELQGDAGVQIADHWKK